MNTLIIENEMSETFKLYNLKISDDDINLFRNIGYYHGIKDYIYIRNKNVQISYKSFQQVLFLNNYDLNLKTLIYPKLMLIENAFKSYMIEALLEFNHSDNFNEVFDNSLTRYKEFKKNSINYNTQESRCRVLKENLITQVISKNKDTSIWSTINSMSLGQLGIFYQCSNLNIKLYISKVLSLPTNYDGNGECSEYFIETLRNLRNAIAHNNVIFDTRFNIGCHINNQIINLLKSEFTQINIDFKYIDSYIILITYILYKMKFPLEDCIKFVNDYNNLTENIRINFSNEYKTFNIIMGSSHKKNMTNLLSKISLEECCNF